MSHQAQNWAYRCRTETSAQKFVLVTLANFASDRGCCHPSLKRLGDDLQMAINTVRARLDELVEQGLIYRTGRMRDDGSHSSNEYILLLDDAAMEYAREKGWVASAVPTPGIRPPSPKRGGSKPDPRQLGLDLQDEPRRETEGGDSNCVEGGGPTARRGVVQLAGPLEPSLNPQMNLPPKPPDPKQTESRSGGGVDPPEAEKDLWPDFTIAYPLDVLDRRVPALEAWNRLQPSERALALEYAPRYAAETEGRGRKRVGMERWLREKGWEPFVEAETRRAAFEQVWIPEGSEEAAAWARHQRVKKLYAWDSKNRRGRGCFKATRWPPDQSCRPPEVGPASPTPRAEQSIQLPSGGQR